MKKRLYSLFEKRNGRWVRMTHGDYIGHICKTYNYDPHVDYTRTFGAFPKETAIRVFQDYMLNLCLSGAKWELRPVKKGEE